VKPLAQFATATLALGALLAAGASHATDIAELPLKASVLAKPNVIFGMDDSGSMAFYAIADGPTLSNARSDLEPQVYNAGTDTLTGDAVDWASDRGWYVDLPAGRQLNTRPSIAYGAVAVVGNFAGASNCAASSRLYVFDVLTGGKFAGADFVSSEIASNSNSSAVTALVTTGHKVVGAGQTAEGTPWRREIATGAPIPPGKNAWREVRR
jgi:type IV pilus assembly protein PilY1